MIKIATLGGYEEVGKNFTVINVDGTVVILDLGLDLTRFIEISEEGNPSKQELINYGALPNVDKLRSLGWPEPLAIIPTHGHLDHIGAISRLASDFKKAKVIATPFTAGVIRKTYESDRITMKNPLEVVNAESTYFLDDNVTIKFNPITHSIVDTALLSIETKYGNIVYANDFKLDRNPVLGQPADLKRIKERVGDVKFLIVDSTGSVEDGKTLSESIVKHLIDDSLSMMDYSENLVVFTTFSSHIARLSTIVKYLKKQRRRVYLLGKSMEKYSSVAQELGYYNFRKSCKVLKYQRQIKKLIKDIDSGKIKREKVALIMTGHQGEPKSILGRIVNGELPNIFKPNDVFVFSSRIIPNPVNEANRRIAEQKLDEFNVRVFKDLHVSGHPSKEDLREFVNILKPQYIIPSHGTFELRAEAAKLYASVGYNLNSEIFLTTNDSILTLDEKGDIKITNAKQEALKVPKKETSGNDSENKKHSNQGNKRKGSSQNNKHNKNTKNSNSKSNSKKKQTSEAKANQNSEVKKNSRHGDKSNKPHSKVNNTNNDKNNNS